MKTLLLIEIDHDKRLPDNLAARIEDSAWRYLQNLGVRVDVRSTEWQALPVKEMRNAPRCQG